MFKAINWWACEYSISSTFPPLQFLFNLCLLQCIDFIAVNFWDEKKIM